MPDSTDPRKPQNGISDDELLAGATPIDTNDQLDDELEPIDFDNGDGDEALDAGGDAARRATDSAGNKIRAFGLANAQAGTREWTRQPTATGQGASHVKTFFGKLRPDAIHHIDDQINQWLDDHPDYEVKLVTTTHGVLKGKTDEEALIVNVWV